MRKQKTIFNVVGTMCSYFVMVLFNFITQRYIIHVLGIEYSGVNGLFSNILTMLSVAELGIGTAIVFKLYKPIKDENYEEINKWMNFYKVCYRYVAIVILVCGVIIVPFIPKIVGKTSINDNLYLLYLISLLDVVFSYLLTYKRSLLYADQKNYIINIIHIFYIVFMNITQIFVLNIFHSYFIFLVVKLFFRIAENLIINKYVNVHYSYLKKTKEKISKVERKDIYERVKAIAFQKISFVVNKGADNLIISLFLGIVQVGLYTNYFTIVNAITSVIYQFVSSFIASVGNLLTDNNKTKNYLIYREITLVNSYISIMGSIMFIIIGQDFIKMWIGEEYLLSAVTLVLFGIYIYVDSIRRSITVFKDAGGICKEDKNMYIIMPVINVFFSILLVYIIGMPGVILGTIFSYLFLIFFSYPKYVFKPLFCKNVKYYYFDFFKYATIAVITFVLSVLILKNVYISNSIIYILIKLMVIFIVGTIVFIILLHNTMEFRELLDLSKKFMRKLIKSKPDKIKE